MLCQQYMRKSPARAALYILPIHMGKYSHVHHNALLHKCVHIQIQYFLATACVKQDVVCAITMCCLFIYLFVQFVNFAFECIYSYSLKPIRFIFHRNHPLGNPHIACAFRDDSSMFDDCMTKTIFSIFWVQMYFCVSESITRFEEFADEQQAMTIFGVHCFCEQHGIVGNPRWPQSDIKILAQHVPRPLRIRLGLSMFKNTMEYQSCVSVNTIMNNNK